MEKSEQEFFVAAIARERKAAFDINAPLAFVYADLVHDQVQVFDQGMGSEVWVPLFREVVSIRRAQLPGHRRLADSVTQLADCLARSSRFADQFREVEGLARENLELLEELSELWGEALTPTVLENRWLLGSSLLGQNRHDEAEPVLFEAYGRAVEALGPTAELCLRLTRDLRAVYGALGKTEQLDDHVEDHQDRVEQALSTTPAE